MLARWQERSQTTKALQSRKTHILLVSILILSESIVFYFGALGLPLACGRGLVMRSPPASRGHGLYHEVTACIMGSPPASWGHRIYHEVTACITRSPPASWGHRLHHEATAYSWGYLLRHEVTACMVMSPSVHEFATCSWSHPYSWGHSLLMRSPPVHEVAACSWGHPGRGPELTGSSWDSWVCCCMAVTVL